MYKAKQTDFSQEGYPQAGYPQGGHPQAGYPQGGYPQAGYPPSQPLNQGEPYPSSGAYPSTTYFPQPEFKPEYPSGDNVPPSANAAPADLGEDGDVKGFDFNEKSIRSGFIRKVYAILATQLLVTLATICVFSFFEPVRFWAFRNVVVLWMALFVLLVSSVAISFCEDMRRQSPINFIFLGLFTVAQSFLLGVVSCRYDSQAVMIAVGITAVICLSLTLFAFQTRFDFTIMGGSLFCALIVLLIFGVVMIFIPRSSILSLVYACFGALLFSIYLVFDTQLMMGGEHKYSISPEEYVFAALNLYLDIINILLYILRIVGRS